MAMEQSSPGPRAPVERATLTRQQKVFTLLGALLGMLLAALDQTIVATAGPTIQRQLQIDASLYAWITTAYLVTSTVFIPIYGKLSDLFGRKPTLISGMVIFLLGSLMCGLATTPFFLILARAVQGTGSAALFTNAFAVVADIFPPAERGKYQGIFGAVWGFSSVVGPLAGGFITDYLGWNWAFFINLPVGAVALGFVITRMPLLAGYAGGQRPRIDYAGALALAVTVVPLLLALSLGRSGDVPPGNGWPWSSWQILALFGLSVVAGAVLIAIEKRAAAPIIDLRLFSHKAVAIGVAATFVAGGAFLASIVFLPLFMTNVVGLSATNTGLTTMPLTMGVVAGNIVSGQLASRLGKYKPIILAALMLLMIGFAIMAFTLRPASTQTEVTLKMILIGLGLGPTIPLYTLAIQNAVAPGQIGVATSAATFFRQIGSTVGVAIVGTVFAATLTRDLRAGMGSKLAFTEAISRVYLIALGLAALAFLITLALPSLRLRRTMSGGSPAA